MLLQEHIPFLYYELSNNLRRQYAIYFRCKKIFSTEKTWQRVADQLVEIARFYRFDGWFINIENNIDVSACLLFWDLWYPSKKNDMILKFVENMRKYIEISISNFILHRCLWTIGGQRGQVAWKKRGFDMSVYKTRNTSSIVCLTRFPTY